jgi:hypothetical protein
MALKILDPFNPGNILSSHLLMIALSLLGNILGVL